MKIKSTIFTKVLSEEYIEVNKSLPATISALREISGASRETFPEDTVITLHCSKKGKIKVSIFRKNVTKYQVRERGDNLYPLYYVYGKVISKDNKTYIKMNSVFKRSDIFIEVFGSLIGVLLMVLYALLLATTPIKLVVLLFSVLVSVLLSLGYFDAFPLRKSRGYMMLPHMERELKNRVKIIEQWE